MKEREKCTKKRTITDLNPPDGSRGIPFQSQEFEQDGSRHFVDVQPHFHLNMTSQTQFFFCIFHALSFQLNFFFDRTCPLTNCRSIRNIRTLVFCTDLI